MLTSINAVDWDGESKSWRGTCPRCGQRGFFTNATEFSYHDYFIEIVKCPGGHPFVIERAQAARNGTNTSYPLQHLETPDWLPEIYTKAHKEMMTLFLQQQYRGAVAVCGIILEAAVNETLKNEGTKRKKLFEKLELLKEKEWIDSDQFSSGTITRLTRNNVIHPEEILEDIKDQDAKEAIDSVLLFLERKFKFRPSRALPAPDETEIQD